MPAFARTIEVVTDDVASQLRAAATGATKVQIRHLPFLENRLSIVEVEPFSVWAKDATVIVHGANGKVERQAPPAILNFKGTVVGEEDSMVFFSLDEKNNVSGSAIVGGRRFTMATGRRITPTAGRQGREDFDRPPLLIDIENAFDDVMHEAEVWTCLNDKVPAMSLRAHLPDERRIKSLAKIGPTLNGGASATYQMRIAVDTDFELFSAFGTSGAVTTYINSLVGQASVIYQRDVATTLILGTVHIYTTASDPWNCTTASGCLAELGTYWHNTASYAADPRSSVVMVSGRNYSSGIGWVGTTCDIDFFCGLTGSNCGSATFANAWGGGYAFCGTAGAVTTTVPDPTATGNGVQYGLPNTSNFWMLLEFVHELGHNFNGPHTQCVPLSAADQVLYSTTRTFVDECYNLDGSGCFSGSTSGGLACSGGYCAGGVPAEKGSIMSYCHNVFSGGFRQSRFLIGKAGEASEKVIPFITSQLDGTTPNAAVTVGSNLACAAGQTASVPACGSCTYSWQITGGSIPGSTTGASVTFTPSAPTVLLTVAITNASGCGVTVQRSISTLCSTIGAPTNVVATASSATAIDVTWTAAVGATSYHIYRTNDGTNFTQQGGNIACCTLAADAASSGNAYIYKVRSFNGVTESADSNKDLAYAFAFTDPTLATGTAGTRVKGAHITELRSAVNAVRQQLTGLGAGTYTTDATIVTGSGGTTVKRLHIIELRTALDAARTALGLTAVSYTTGTITANVTTIKKTDITDLRGGVQ